MMPSSPCRGEEKEEEEEGVTLPLASCRKEGGRHERGGTECWYCHTHLSWPHDERPLASPELAAQ